MHCEIKHLSTDRVLWQGEAASFKEAVVTALYDGANLRDANLRDANLRDANLGYANLCRANISNTDLRRANLRGADLRRADLRGADLGWADLRDANLSDADIHRADLCEANLHGADLSRADLSYAHLRDANLSYAHLRDVNLRGASLRGANLRGVKGLPPVPVIPDLDKRILAAISNGQPRLGWGEGQRLDMRAWHTCETTHCRAGWAITLAGEAGKELEAQLGSNVAGALLYSAAYPDLPVPDFRAIDEDALADIRKRAAI